MRVRLREKERKREGESKSKSMREKKTDWKKVRDNSCKGNKCVFNVRKIEIGR